LAVLCCTELLPERLVALTRIHKKTATVSTRLPFFIATAI
jgi:hypothetical protein